MFPLFGPAAETVFAVPAKVIGPPTIVETKSPALTFTTTLVASVTVAETMPLAPLA
jgi:hypothetical protein